MLLVLGFLISWMASNMATFTIQDEYKFPATECNKGKFLDTGAGFLGYLTPATAGSPECLLTDGVSSRVKLRSQNAVSVLSAQSYTPMTLEMWVAPNDHLSGDAAIISFGKDGVQSDGCTNNLVVSQLTTPSSLLLNQTAYMVTACNAEGVTTLKVLTSPLTSVQKVDGHTVLHHVAVGLTFAQSSSTYSITASFVINGVYIPGSDKTFATEYGTFDPSSWDSAGFLNVFPSMGIIRASAGSVSALHNFALYNLTLSVEEVRARYAARLPDSPPAVLNHTATIQENGEVGDHALVPEFYLSGPIPPAELPVLHLQAAPDLESYAYDTPSAEHRPRLYISAFPANAELFLLDGTPLLPPATGAAPTFIAYDTFKRSYPVRIRPPLDQFSASPSAPLCSFSFSAADGVTGQPALHAALAQIIVTHVDKPPVALANASTALANVFVPLDLRGYDVDSAVTGCLITQLPAHGELYQANADGERGTRLLAHGNFSAVSGSGPPSRVWYRFTGALSSPGGTAGVVGADHFTFVLEDIEGRRSVPAAHFFTLTTALTALPVSSTSPLATEGATSAISLHGQDIASNPRALYATIVTPPRYGRLFHSDDAAETAPILSNTILVPALAAGNYTAGIPVQYHAAPGYFSSPAKTWAGEDLGNPLDYFTYKVTSADGGESKVVRQYVGVQNVNDPTLGAFAYPSQQTTLTAVLSKAGNSILEITGFNITDPDLGVDVVRATVATLSSKAAITLNQTALDGVDFNSAKYCSDFTASWSCTGDGTSSYLSFVGTPAAIEAVLNGMVYTGPAGAATDEVTVTLYDGEGGECLSTEQQGAGSIRTGCFTTAFTIQITLAASDDAGLGGGSASSAVMARLMYVAIGLVVCFVLVALRCFLQRRRRQLFEKEDKADHTSEPRGAPPSTHKRGANIKYSSLPMGSPTSTPQRTRRASSKPRTSGKAIKRAAPQGNMDSDSDSDAGTEEEGFDIEACRTPPRRKKQTSGGTAPCTPATPAADSNIRVSFITSPRDRSNGETPTRTLLLTRDVVSPDGSIRSETTHIIVPADDQCMGGHAISLGKAAKASKKAFPELKELGRREAPQGGHPPGTMKQIHQEPYRMALDGTDRSVSTMSCSVPSTHDTPSNAKRSSSSPARKFIPSPGSDASPKRRPVSPAKCAPLRAEGIASPGSHVRRKHGVPLRALGSTPGVFPASGVVSQAEFLDAEWTEHIHRSGRLFYHNNRTGQSTWKKPAADAQV